VLPPAYGEAGQVTAFDHAKKRTIGHITTQEAGPSRRDAGDPAPPAAERQ